MKDGSSKVGNGSGETLTDSVDPLLQKTIWRKLDFYILPVVAMFYFLSFLVRVGHVSKKTTLTYSLSDRIGQTSAMLVSLACKVI